MIGLLGAVNPAPFVLCCTAAKTGHHAIHKTERSRPGAFPSAEIEHEEYEMFAVIKTGGKQYRVAAEDVITVGRVAGEPGDRVELGEVLMVGGDQVVVGSPLVAGASVAAELVKHSRGDKVIAFKKRRRKNSRRKRGHRQELSVIRITEILTDGRRPSEERAPSQESAPAPEPAAAAPEPGEASAPPA
jgi:large subunit ribosomal protein L21